jgi:uncharacterized protein YceK
MSPRSNLKRPLVAVVLAATALLSGCASLLEEDTQEVNVRFMCAEKHLVATCDLKNDKGRWRLSTPGKATVINDTSLLEISCKAPFIPSFSVSVMPMPSMGMLGNLLFGGVVGAAVDVYNNSGMKYPENIDISNPNCK